MLTTVINSDTLASASYDKTIKLWNLSNGTLIRTLTGHTNGVNALTDLTVGSIGHLVSASSDKTMNVWDATSGKVVLTISATQAADVKVLLNLNKVNERQPR